jgi:cytochrome b561
MQPTGYSRIQIILHWVIFLLVASQFVFHDAMVAAWREWQQTHAVALTPLAIGHLAGGTLILILALWRLAIRRTRGAPPPPAGEAGLQAMVAKVTHWTLYALLILVPVTGLVAWVGDVKTAGGIHGLLKNIMFFAILLHFAGAVYNQVILRNHLLRRMMKAEG